MRVLSKGHCLICSESRHVRHTVCPHARDTGGFFVACDTRNCCLIALVFHGVCLLLPIKRDKNVKHFVRSTHLKLLLADWAGEVLRPLWTLDRHCDVFLTGALARQI